MIRYPNLHIVLLTVVFLLPASGCLDQSKQSGEQYFARVGDRQLTFEEARSKIPDQHLRQDSIRSLLDYRSRWIREQLMVQEAERLNLNRNKAVRQEIDRLRQRVYIQALQDYVLENRKQQIETTREETRDFYQQNKNKFTLQERHVRFRHMITRSLKQAEDAKSELLGGVEWKEVARKYHVNPEQALKHSDQFNPISMAVSEVPRMQRYLQVIGINEISPIQSANGNYHFVQLLDERSRGHNPDLDWALEHVERWLTVKKKKDELNAYIKNLYLRARANNEIETVNVFDSDTIENQSFNDTTQTPFHD